MTNETIETDVNQSTTDQHLESIINQADTARVESEIPPPPDSQASAEEAAVPKDLTRVSKFLVDRIAKAGNRLVPGWWSEADQAELTELLLPVLTKHQDKIPGWLEKWMEEILLGVFVIDKAVAAYELVQLNKLKSAKQPTEQPNGPPRVETPAPA